MIRRDFLFDIWADFDKIYNMKLDSKIAAKFNKILEKEGILALAKKMSKEHKGAEMYLVGGAVRDIIIGRPVKDMDVLVRKVKIKDLEKFLAKSGKVDLVGKRFSVLKFTPKNGEKQIDIALPRTDFAYGTGGYKDFKVKANPNLPIEDDLARRDFTVNAMAWNVVSGEIVDPYHGLADLKKKIIRAVGKPQARFAEDYSRMLRAIRFGMQLDFKIETKTWAAVKRYIGRINDTTAHSPSLTKEGKGEERKVPYEVIASEFLKSFGARPVETIKKYLECGALKKLMPEIIKMKECTQPKEFHSEGNVFTHTLLALQNIDSKFFKKYFSEPVSLTAKVAILLHDVGKPETKTKKDGRTVFYNHDKAGAEIARKFLERLKFSSPPEVGVNTEEIAWLVSNHLLFLYSDPAIIKKTTLEKYLFHRVYSGTAFMQLYLADAMASVPDKSKTDLTRFFKAYEIWQSLKGKQRPIPPAPFLDGDEIMKIMKIKSGIEVGEIIMALREEQLNGRVKNKKDAGEFIKKIKN